MVFLSALEIISNESVLQVNSRELLMPFSENKRRRRVVDSVLSRFAKRNASRSSSNDRIDFMIIIPWRSVDHSSQAGKCWVICGDRKRILSGIGPSGWVKVDKTQPRIRRESAALSCARSLTRANIIISRITSCVCTLRRLIRVRRKDSWWELISDAFNASASDRSH